MSKTITLRVPDEVYKALVAAAEAEHRPISNLILHHVRCALDKPISSAIMAQDQPHPPGGT